MLFHHPVTCFEQLQKKIHGFVRRGSVSHPANEAKGGWREPQGCTRVRVCSAQLSPIQAVLLPVGGNNRQVFSLLTRQASSSTANVTAGKSRGS